MTFESGGESDGPARHPTGLLRMHIHMSSSLNREVAGGAQPDTGLTQCQAGNQVSHTASIMKTQRQMDALQKRCEKLQKRCEKLEAWVGREAAGHTVDSKE